MTGILQTALIWMALMGSSQSDSYDILLSRVANDELSLVNRIGMIRKATEKLPQDWKTESAVEEGQKKTFTRADILNYLDQLELTAAKRWEVLLKNTATLNTAQESRLPDTYLLVRQDLKKIPQIHSRINKTLDQINELLKEGILFNLANQVPIRKELN